MITLKHENKNNGSSSAPAKPKNPFLARAVLTSALAVGCVKDDVANGLYAATTFGPWLAAACAFVFSKEDSRYPYDPLAADNNCFKKRNRY